jgi:hypothetical protein
MQALIAYTNRQGEKPFQMDSIPRRASSPSF